MAGLLSGGGAGGGTTTMDKVPMRSEAHAAGAPEPMEGDGEQSNVSPEEQAQYDKFVDNGLSIIFDKGTAPKLLGRIKASGSPVEGLATSTVMVVGALQESAKKRGMEISPDVLLHGGEELMGQIAELSKAAQVHEFSDEEKENALYVALDQYGTMAMERGTLDKNAIAQDFQAMLAADKEGRIDELLPGLSEKAKEIEGKRGPDDEPFIGKRDPGAPAGDEDDNGILRGMSTMQLRGFVEDPENADSPTLEAAKAELARRSKGRE